MNDASTPTQTLDSPMRFGTTAMTRKKRRAESMAKWTFFMMAVAMIMPLMALLLYLVVHAWPSLGLEFILDIPRRGMTEGGVGKPIVVFPLTRIRSVKEFLQADDLRALFCSPADLGHGFLQIVLLRFPTGHLDERDANRTVAGR